MEKEKNWVGQKPWDQWSEQEKSLKGNWVRASEKKRLFSKELEGGAGFNENSQNEKLKHPSDLVCRLDDIAFCGEKKLGTKSVKEKS